MSEIHIDGEVVAEEDAEPQDAEPVRALPLPYESSAALPVLRGDVRNAAIAAAGGVLAGAATVAAVRAVSSVGAKSRSPRRLARRRGRPENVVASRSFLVDVHLLGR
ncbi:MAG TPA: hypothetical protein VGO36_03075 [Solirubrobacterales bacterium]|nr:hypothetical protein [Solirubrobacterales bacterium]